MKSATHFWAAASAAPATWMGLGAADDTAATAAVIGLLAGAKAPDWLEIRRWFAGKRFSLIPHRSLTHTWWVWVGALIAIQLTTWYNDVKAFGIAFCASCLLHIGMDALTPMGVPILNPFGRRKSLPLGILSTDLGFFVASQAAGLAAVYIMLNEVL